MSEFPVNPTVSLVESIIHTAITEVAVAAAIQAATAELPWLGLPFIRQIFSWAVNYAFAFIDKYLEQAAAFTIIDSQTNAEAAKYMEAVNVLKAAQLSGDPHALSEATQSFKNNLADLIHFRTQ